MERQSQMLQKRLESSAELVGSTPLSKQYALPGTALCGALEKCCRGDLGVHLKAGPGDLELSIQMCSNLDPLRLFIVEHIMIGYSLSKKSWQSQSLNRFSLTNVSG